MSAAIFDVVSGLADHLTADFERRVHSGPKERTHSNDNVQLSAQGRSVHVLSVSLSFNFSACS